jgi:hypothetical protein
LQTPIGADHSDADSPAAKKPVETVKQIAGTFPGDVDVPRMRAGKVGGLFMSVWIPCGPGTDFLAPSHVRATRKIPSTADGPGRTGRLGGDRHDSAVDEGVGGSMRSGRAQ